MRHLKHMAGVRYIFDQIEIVSRRDDVFRPPLQLTRKSII